MHFLFCVHGFVFVREQNSLITQFTHRDFVRYISKWSEPIVGVRVHLGQYVVILIGRDVAEGTCVTDAGKK